jgi:hypothetical protein
VPRILLVEAVKTVDVMILAVLGLGGYLKDPSMDMISQ